MEKHRELVGYIDHNDAHYPFQFDRDSFMITFFPPSREQYQEDLKPVNLFKGLLGNENEIDWVPKIELEGITNDFRRVVFCVTENPSSSLFSSFSKNKVNWCVVLDRDIDSSVINGFDVFGNEIDFFFPPHGYLARQFDEIGNRVELRQIKVDPAIHVKHACGSYWLNEETKISMQVSTLVIWDSDAYIAPINAVSRFETFFSNPVSFKEVQEAYRNLYQFLMFITNRNNIEHFDLRLLGKDTKGHLDYVGTFYMKPADVSIEGKEEDVRGRAIKYKDIGENTGSLIGIMNDDFSIVYRPVNDSLQAFGRWSYPKLIAILVILDNNLKNCYGQKTTRSAEFREVKRTILSSITIIKEGLTGKKRRYASEHINLVRNHDNSYQSRVLHALKDNQAAIEPFIRSLLGYEGSFEKIANEIADRVGYLRNDLAHGRFGVDIDPMVLIDMRVIEILNYIIILKRGEVGERSCVNALGELFDDKLALLRYDGKY